MEIISIRMEATAAVAYFEGVQGELRGDLQDVESRNRRLPDYSSPSTEGALCQTLDQSALAL
jgi:hypothetical protein